MYIDNEKSRIERQLEEMKSKMVKRHDKNDSIVQKLREKNQNKGKVRFVVIEED